jgi:serine/threonine-protein kinase
MSSDWTTQADIPPAPPPPPRPGAARYRVLHLHATGGLGQVSLAVEEELHREVALKQIQDRHASDADCRARFLREAEITARLEHPGIVPVYGLDSDEQGRPRYAMRFIRGESLHDAIRHFHEADQSRRDPSERALALRGLLRRFVDVCNAVAYAHSKGVIHRDLKPANVMLGDYGETLVVDWGLARVLDQEDAATQPYRGIETRLDSGSTPTQQGQVVGTLAYMAPEQARGEQERVGIGSDVFSLGATLYCLLTGEPPYHGNRDEVLALACQGQVLAARQVNARVPAALEAVCRKALSSRPEDRYASVRELAAEVERWLADEPLLAHRESPATRLRRWGRRHRSVVAAALVLLVASVVGLSLGLWAVGVEQQETARQRDLALEAEQRAKDNQAAAQKAEAQAKKELARADHNLKLARHAVDECFGVAREHPLLQGDNLKQVKKLLLTRTLPFFNHFSKQTPEDRTLTEQQVEDLFKVGYITDEIGSKEEALAWYERARAVLLALVKAHPRVPRYRAALATIWDKLGNFQAETGKPAEALASFQKGLDLRLAVCKDHPDVADYQADLAINWSNLGILHRQRGEPALAVQSYEKARDLLLALGKAHPAVPRYRSNLANTLHHLGVILREAGNSKEALANFEQARDIHLALSTAHPNVTAYQADVANTFNSLAVLQREMGKPAEALTSYERARDIWLALSRAYPDVTSYRAGLGKTWNNLAYFRTKTGKASEALACYKEALDTQLALHRDHPEVTAYQADLGGTYCNLGHQFRASDRASESLPPYAEAIRMLRAVLQREPGHSTARVFLRNSHGGRARALTALGRHGEAAADLEQAIRLDTGPSQSAFRMELALALAHAGDHARAVQEARHLLRLHSEMSGTQAYSLACIYALSARAAVKETSRPLAEREKRGEGYARLALRLLERLRQAGSFDVRQAVEQMKKDPDLDFLRNRDDFRQFLSAVEEKR